MTRLMRLLRYVRPYWLQAITSVILLAAVGALDAFRLVLVKPIFDQVLHPGSADPQIMLFTIPHTQIHVDLRQFVPSHFHNVWTSCRHRSDRFHLTQGTLRLHRHLPGELCRASV